MNLKTGILGAAAALTLALPAVASAQSYYSGYGDAPRYATRDYRADYRRDEYRRDDWRRDEWRRERRREEERRLRWEREHRYGYGYRYDDSYGYGYRR